MKIMVICFIIGLAMCSVFYLWGFYEGERRAACWNSDLESFEVHPVPDSSPFQPPGDPF